MCLRPSDRVMKKIDQKREEAEQRQRAREMRTIQQQLDLIQTRRGSSKKEKQKLLDQLLEIQNRFHSNGKHTH